jgi:hypothetical protein
MNFVLGIIKRQSVVFTKIAQVLNHEVKDESNLRRIQDFFADYALLDGCSSFGEFGSHSKV